MQDGTGYLPDQFHPSIQKGSQYKCQSIENVGESTMSEMVLTTEQKAWNPGKAGTDATKAGDSPSRGRVEDMIWVPTT